MTRWIQLPADTGTLENWILMQQELAEFSPLPNIILLLELEPSFKGKSTIHTPVPE